MDHSLMSCAGSRHPFCLLPSGGLKPHRAEGKTESFAEAPSLCTNWKRFERLEVSRENADLIVLHRDSQVLSRLVALSKCQFLALGTLLIHQQV